MPSEASSQNYKRESVPASVQKRAVAFQIDVEPPSKPVDIPRKQQTAVQPLEKMTSKDEVSRASLEQKELMESSLVPQPVKL